MNILFLCHRFPYPPHAGSKLRAFHCIRHLAQRHRVTVCSLARSREEAQAGHGISPWCHSYRMLRVQEPLQRLHMLASLAGPRPASMAYFYSRPFAAEVRAAIAEESIDLALVHCSSVAPLIERLRDLPKLLDFCDMDSQKWLDYAAMLRWPWSWGYKLEAVKLRAAEARLANAFDISTVATAAELALLNDIAPGAPADCFPNGVDADYFAPGEEYEPDTLSFTGRMDYYPNVAAAVSFCTDVLPLIRKRRPAVRLSIVGADPAPAVRRLASIEGVTVTGRVPDVRPHVRACAAAIAPLSIARGTQNKILEAMAMGVPVIASALAARGVDAMPGEHLLAASRPAEFAEAVLRVLSRPEERARLAASGRARVVERHSWGAAMRKLDAIIERLAGRGAPSLASVPNGTMP